MSIALIVSAGLIWWFLGLVPAQLIARRWYENPSIKKQAGPFIPLIAFLISLLGPIALYVKLSGVVADKIEESQARKQVQQEMVAERNQMRLEYAEKLLKESGMKVDADKWGDEFDLDTEIE